MFERASRKLGVDKAIMSSLTIGQIVSENKQEFENMLKYGVYAIIDDSVKDKQLQELSIEEILKTRSRKIEENKDENKSKNDLSKISFTRMNFIGNKNDKDLDVNAPDFWDIILKSTGQDDKNNENNKDKNNNKDNINNNIV